MKAVRLRECLLALHWSSLTLVDVLETDAGTVMAWYYGRESVPEAVAEWLEKLASFHEATPPIGPKFMMSDSPKSQ